MKKALTPVKEPSTAVLKKELQILFNAFIRKRDQDKKCIYCGTPLTPFDRMNPTEACHYYPTSTSEALRFDETNVHAGHRYCNQDNNQMAMRFHMLGRGVSILKLDALSHSLAKHTRDELQDLINKYK